MKILFVGDIHATVNNLDDTMNLFRLVAKSAEKADIVIFLGDIFHTHAVIRQEVAYCVREGFDLIKNTPTFIIAGNHDGSSPSSVQKNALDLTLSGRPNLSVICQEKLSSFVNIPVDFIPFIGNKEMFLKEVSTPRNKILICHQTFTGAKFENGFFAPEGIDQGLVNYDLIISGHIHCRQKIGKVYYTGSCRAISANEVNDSKYLTIFDTETYLFDDICTDDHVKCFRDLSYIQGKDEIGPITGNLFKASDIKKQQDDIRVHIHGNEQYYFDFVEMNKGMIGLVKFVPHIKKNIEGKIVLEKEGTNIDKEFRRYIYEISNIDNSKKDLVWQKIETYRK